MVKLHYKLLAVAVLVAIAILPGYSQARIVLDTKCVEQVTKNMALQKAVEEDHNHRLDSILSKQEKIQQMTTTMAVIAETYQYVMQNYKGFGSESKYYTEIGLCAYDIALRVPRVTQAIMKAKFPQKASCVLELSNIYTKTYQLVDDFVNIVTNAKVKHPLESGKKTKEDEKNKGDGYNLLSRYDRISVANRIYTDLLELRYKMESIEMMAQYATWHDLWMKIDVESWAAVMTGINHAKTLANQWNGLSSSL